MMLSALISLSFAENDIMTPEQEVVSLYNACEMAGGSHVWDMFIELSGDMEKQLETIYDHHVHEDETTRGWKFKEPLIQECYNSVREAASFQENDHINKKQFVEQMGYILQDKLIESFDNKLRYSPMVKVENLDLHLRGNEKSISIEENPVSKRVDVIYERDEQAPEQPERVVRIKSLYGYVPHGFKPYFMLPKDLEIVGCDVFQTSDHAFLREVQNIFHCCCATQVTYKDGTIKDFDFWRDGQERVGDKLLEHQDATKFIKVYFKSSYIDLRE